MVSLIMTLYIHRSVLQRPHVLWADNFSKFIAHSIPTTTKDVFASCLWTGMAAFSTDNEQLDMSIKYSVDGSIVPAMPNDPLVGRNTVVKGIRYILESSRNYFDQSLVKKFDVRCIPLKINSKLFPNLAYLVDNARNTTQIVHPVKLLEINIGSNHGLLTILRQIYEEEGMHTDTCANYKILNTDENIYWRTMKVKSLFELLICFFSPQMFLNFVENICGENIIYV